LIKDLPPEDSPASQALAAAGYMAIANEPNMVLHLDPSWRTHGDYLSSMTSRYRRSCKRVFRRVSESGFQVEPLDDLRGNASTLHRLYLHVQAQAVLRPLALPADFLPMLGESLELRFRCLVIRSASGHIVAFVTMIRDAETAVGYFLGYDPEINRAVPLYLRLLHAVVEEALRTGCRSVSFGRTALEPKARLGAEQVPLNIWVRHPQRSLPASIAAWLQTALFERAPTRHPFG
jgi:predicted N-acyltransferase